MKSSSWGWKSAKTICLVIIGALILIGWIVYELWKKNPLVPMRLLMGRDLFFLTVVGFLVGFAMFGTFQALPYLLMSPIMPFGYALPNHFSLLSFRYTKQMDGSISFLIVCSFFKLES